MLKNFFPNKILSFSNKFFSFLIVLMILFCFCWINLCTLYFTLLIIIQGDSVRIMYVHVPASFIALGCFGFMGIASICAFNF